MSSEGAKRFYFSQLKFNSSADKHLFIQFAHVVNKYMQSVAAGVSSYRLVSLVILVVASVVFI